MMPKITAQTIKSYKGYREEERDLFNSSHDRTDKEAYNPQIILARSTAASASRECHIQSSMQH